MSETAQIRQDTKVRKQHTNVQISQNLFFSLNFFRDKELYMEGFFQQVILFFLILRVLIISQSCNYFSEL